MPMLNKVPEVTLIFWIVKILSTTVGETAADFLAFNLDLGMELTGALMVGLLALAFWWQLTRRRCVQPAYWLVVVLISVVGTLFSDAIVDGLDISLETSTAVFGVILALVFAGWYRVERTLSIHTIVTRRREWFYWAAILFTFSLGTSAGDLLSEGVGIGYAPAAAMFGGAIAVVYLAWRAGLNGIPAFWAAYVLTRPFGASMGDLLAQGPDAGGLGFGTVVTSEAFLAVIAALVVVLTLRDRWAVRS
jgi:uncharacterized membrane-anchored protein